MSSVLNAFIFVLLLNETFLMQEFLQDFYTVFASSVAPTFIIQYFKIWSCVSNINPKISLNFILMQNL